MIETGAAANNGQAAAIKHREGPALVIAGPGSGKTYTITKRLEYLTGSCHIEPSNILTITFTNSAAKEMRSRAYSLIGGSAGGITFGTFHSVFYSVLKNTFSLNSSNILRSQDKYMLLSGIARTLGIDAADMGMVCDRLSAFISRRKNGLKAPGGFETDTEEKIFSMYTERLKELGVIDFDDMIIKTRSLFKKEPGLLHKWQERFRYIMVDEYQDCNLIQHETVRLLAGDSANIMAVGDDDQSIYGFRGASPSIINRFLEDYPPARVFELDVNYRCYAPIADAADKVIAANPDRIIKHHSSLNRTGEDVDIRCFKDRSDEISAVIDEIDIAHPDDYCLLIRTNEMASYFADGLERAGIPVCIKGKRKNRYDTDIGKDVVSYLRISSGVYGRADLLRVMNKPMRLIGREAFRNENARVQDALAFYRGVRDVYDNAARFSEDVLRMRNMKPKAAMRYLMKVIGYEKYLKNEGRDTDELYLLYETASGFSSIGQWLAMIENESERDKDENINSTNNPGVSVMTLHASKGLEFSEVFIMDINDGIIPYHRAALMDEIEEERRLLYVGMTRAIKKLHLFYIEESNCKPMLPSPFLKAFDH